jgi:hypothetical protein
VKAVEGVLRTETIVVLSYAKETRALNVWRGRAGEPPLMCNLHRLRTKA